MARRTALLKAHAREWGLWKQIEITEDMRREAPHLMHCANIWANNRYEVQSFLIESSIGGVWQVTAIRHGDIATISWEELQRIIHDLYGPEVTAVEVYPPIVSEWGTKVGVRVLWVLPSTWPLPFGLEKPTAWGKPA